MASKSDIALLAPTLPECLPPLPLRHRHCLAGRWAEGRPRGAKAEGKIPTSDKVGIVLNRGMHIAGSYCKP
jgi:hypothetical protein